MRKNNNNKKKLKIPKAQKKKHLKKEKGERKKLKNKKRNTLKQRRLSVSIIPKIQNFIIVCKYFGLQKEIAIFGIIIMHIA